MATSCQAGWPFRCPRWPSTACASLLSCCAPGAGGWAPRMRPVQRFLGNLRVRHDDALVICAESDTVAQLPPGLPFTKMKKAHHRRDDVIVRLPAHPRLHAGFPVCCERWPPRSQASRGTLRRCPPLSHACYSTGRLSRAAPGSSPPLPLRPTTLAPSRDTSQAPGGSWR